MKSRDFKQKKSPPKAGVKVTKYHMTHLSIGIYSIHKTALCATRFDNPLLEGVWMLDAPCVEGDGGGSGDVHRLTAFVHRD